MSSDVRGLLGPSTYYERDVVPRRYVTDEVVHDVARYARGLLWRDRCAQF